MTGHSLGRARNGRRGRSAERGRRGSKKVEEVMAGMKGKPVHKGVLGKTQDTSLKTILEYVQTQ